MAQRSTPQAIGRAAVDDLAAALRHYGLTVQQMAWPSDHTRDLMVTSPTGEPLAAVTVKGAAVVTPERAAALGRFSGPDPFAVGVVVADQISAEAKRRLRRAGWGFYDRRGDLVLRTPRLVVEASLPRRARGAPTRGGSPLGTRAGLTLACALLLDPTTPVVLRDVARRSGLDPGDMSRAARALRSKSLLRGDRTPLVPELFWEVSEHWRPQRVPVAVRPPTDVAVLGGPRAALAWGAAVVTTTNYPPDLYVSDQATLERLAAAASPPSPGAEVATLAVALTPLLLAEPSTRAVESYPLCQALFAALDLSIDKARGVELLDDFDPEGSPRVW